MNDWILNTDQPDYIIVQSFRLLDFKGMNFDKKLDFPVFEEVKIAPQDYLIVFPKYLSTKDFSISYNFDQLKFDISP